jgi:hypothetical protein
LYLAKSLGCEREVGRISHELEGSAVLGSALDALGCQRRWAAVQKQRNVKLMKSSEEDGMILQSEKFNKAPVFTQSL